jgi:hypothetical protein
MAWAICECTADGHLLLKNNYELFVGGLVCLTRVCQLVDGLVGLSVGRWVGRSVSW